MGIWLPEVQVQSNRVLELNRSNPAVWTYTLPGNRQFPASTTAVLTLKNTYGQVVGTWTGVVAGGTVAFSQSATIADAIPRGTSWTLIATYGGTDPRMLAQGTVIRSEAPFPDAPPQSSQFDGVAYSYSFGTAGFVFDPSWRILNGKPRVYDNSGASHPNAVAAGTILTGSLPWDDVAMLWFAPTKTDAVRFTYNTVPAGNGELWIVICSNYDMTNYLAIHHVVGGTNSVAIATGTGPVTVADRATATHTTGLENWTAVFNPSSNTTSVYLGTSLTPLVSWVDSTHVVDHGEGERYVGIGAKSSVLTPGPELCDWFISDSV